MRYVWRDGRFRHPRTNEPMPLPEGNEVCAPIVRSDIAEYRSPIDGTPITSRSQRRYDLEKNGCVEKDPRPKEKRGYKNPKFALKRGLPLKEEARDKLAGRMV